ncbi:hypothetical protein VHUM_02594 [Vanrija humicola]|uniref:Mannosyltransferase n=1 Tax=Vanrija humicola TaxID=5417 RepID=A0A7D8YZZ9_VANHU|nr:hypothetical protein VHUM_02594 [Vanrija humicola]
MALPGTETIRFRRPTAGPNAVAQKSDEPKKDQFGDLAPTGWKKRHQGLLQDQVGRQQRGPTVPSLSFAFRILLLMRTAGAMYAVIADCDEVFNFFEPLHYFVHNAGFQTWEQSPEFAVRSWAYIVLHWPFASLGPYILGLGKRQQFFALRMFLGGISSFVEARFYRAVVEAVNERVGRYVLFALLFSAGMWTASVAFLPSSFTMYTTALAASEWFHPATSTRTGVNRAFRATLFTAIGAIVGWPFAAALGIPFVLEYAFLAAGETVLPKDRLPWGSKRLSTLVGAIVVSAAVAIPVALFDSWAYGRFTFPTLNIVFYNLFSSNGPDLYGTESASYYFLNLFLNFNFLAPLALLSLPALVVTYNFDFRRLGKTQMKPKEGETSPYTLLAVRLSPFYLWLAILTLQSHKEERFMYPAYPLLVFNAAVTVFLVKGWLETAFVKITKSPYRAGQTNLFSQFSFLAIIIPSILSIGRIFALFQFYHAPFDVAAHFQYTTIPNILSGMGYMPIPPPKGVKPREDHVHEWDFAPLAELENPVTVCFGSEWHRFPSSYLFPEGVELRWIKSEFDGMMPRPWDKSEAVGLWPRAETRVAHFGRFNGENKASAEPGTYVPIEQCTHLVTLSLPSQTPTALEPDYSLDEEHWSREYCTTFLDGASSKWWSRLIWLPANIGDKGRVYGDYCLLRRK